MDFERFKEQLMEDLKDRLFQRTGEEVVVSSSKVNKLQNASYEGIVVRKENDPVGINLDAGRFYDVFPVTKELRDKINEAAIESYENGGKIVGFECDPKAMQKANPWHTAKEGPEEKPSVLRYLQEESKVAGGERQIKLSMAPRTDMER